jgi:cytochrome b involved in lipid metabolism
MRTKLIFGISLFIAFAFMVALFLAGFVFMGNGNTNKINNSVNIVASNISNVSSPNVISSTGILLDAVEVAKHNSVSDCWMIIHGKVYDLTNFEGVHPGGSYSIVQFCGTDASAGFDMQHSSRQLAKVASYVIGNLGDRISTLDKTLKIY